MSLADGGVVREGGEDPGPAVRPLRRNGCAFGPEPFPSAVFEQHAGAPTFGHETDVDLGVAPPLRAPPREHDQIGRRARHNRADLHLVTVDEAFEEAAANNRLQEDAVRAVAPVRVALRERPPLADSVGEQAERFARWQLDVDRLAYGKRTGGDEVRGRLALSSDAPTHAVDGCLLLGRLLVAGEGCGPKRSRVGLEPGEPFGIDLVHAPRAGGVIGHQAGGLEHLEVLGYGGPSDRECASNLHDRLRPGTQLFEDGAAGPIAECIEQ